MLASIARRRLTQLGECRYRARDKSTRTDPLVESTDRATFICRQFVHVSQIERTAATFMGPVHLGKPQGLPVDRLVPLDCFGDTVGKSNAIIHLKKRVVGVRGFE